MHVYFNYGCIRMCVCCVGTLCWLHLAALQTSAVFWLVSSLHWPLVTPPVLNQYFGRQPLRLKSFSFSLLLCFIKMDVEWPRDIMTHCIINIAFIFSFANEISVFFYVQTHCRKIQWIHYILTFLAIFQLWFNIQNRQLMKVLTFAVLQHRQLFILPWLNNKEKRVTYKLNWKSNIRL